MSANNLTVRSPIIPSSVSYYTLPGEEKLDYAAICCFAALGFFLDDDTYFTNRKAFRPATNYVYDQKGELIRQHPYFKWHHEPTVSSLDEAVEMYKVCFEGILSRLAAGREKLILPLSGGLDSRTLAAGLHRLGADVSAFSYEFSKGHAETTYGQVISSRCGFKFQGWRVPEGYLWSCLDEVSTINGCYADFTNPRQMAFIDRYSALGDLFVLGHWGDVLFDDMGVEDTISFEEQVNVTLKKVIKEGGLELGASLWREWGIKGEFDEYLRAKVTELLRAIDIQNSANARIRAFKSLHWATRWTSVNLAIFEHVKPITVPYYDNSICEFICSVPEHYLAKRQIQIGYLRRYSPDLANVPWQRHYPFSVDSYEWDRAPFNYPWRFVNWISRKLEPSGFVQRNWELQFLGEENNKLLKWHLVDSYKPGFVPKGVLFDFVKKFEQHGKPYAHPVTMLLTLQMFQKHFLKNG